MNKGVGFKLITIVCLSMLLLGSINIYINYSRELELDYQEKYQEFDLVADVIENDIQRWLNGRENEVILMSKDPLLQQYINALGTANEGALAAKQRQYWLDMQTQYGSYDEIYLITASGHIMLSTDQSRINTARPVDDLVKLPLSTGSICFQDAYYSLKNNQHSIAFSIPVINWAQPYWVEYVGVLVCRINIDEVVNPLLNSRMNLGETGDVILIDKERTVLTGLRNQIDSARHVKLNSELVTKVSRGEEGTWRGIGYNGKEIIAVYRYIPKSQWGLIIRQETDEVFAASKTNMKRLMTFNISLVLFVLIVLYLSVNRVLRPLVVMAENARNFSRGDFSKRIRVESKDEIGTLGDALNFMARGLSEQFQMQQNRQLILEQLGSTIELNALLSNAFGKICSTMGFQVGAVFLVDAEGKRLVRQALYCPGEEMLTQREELKMEEGLEGLAVTTLQPQILKDIPPDTAYAVNWLGGNIKPAAIVAVPLVFNGQAIGVVSLAALQPITDRQLAELSDLCSLAGVAINNALSHRRAVELSHRLQRMNEQLVHQNEVLNAQSEELKAQSVELQAYAEEMRAQTEELQATSHELQLKNEELLRLGRQKSKFMAALSHELRAPLNAVIGFSDVLLDKVVGDLNSNQEKYLQEINVSGQHLLNLIDDLLDLTKLEIAEMELHLAAVDPADSLEKALAMVQADVQTKQLQVTNQLCQHRYTVWADRDKLRQVFLNLLTNAVKFTPSGGKITISAAGQNNMLAISIADTGIGIAQQDQEVIFDEFRQVGAISKEYGGTGLGLAIAKNLVQLHGGSIGVTSEEGQGAVFTFTLPMVSDDVRYLKKPADRDVLLAELAKANGGKSAADTTVLVIDDDYSVRDYLATVLKKEGYRVIMADTGQQGIELAIGSNPDIIILDVVMPQVDGFAVMGALNKSGCRPKVIIYTSQSLTLAEKQRLER